MKTVERLKTRFADRLDTTKEYPGAIWKEWEGGWWAFLKEGWVCMSTQSRSCHEKTLRELSNALRDAYEARNSLGGIRCGMMGE